MGEFIAACVVIYVIYVLTRDVGVTHVEPGTFVGPDGRRHYLAEYDDDGKLKPLSQNAARLRDEGGTRPSSGVG